MSNEVITENENSNDEIAEIVEAGFQKISETNDALMFVSESIVQKTFFDLASKFIHKNEKGYSYDGAEHVKVFKGVLKMFTILADQQAEVNK